MALGMDLPDTEKGIAACKTDSPLSHFSINNEIVLLSFYSECHLLVK